MLTELSYLATYDLQDNSFHWVAREYTRFQRVKEEMQEILTTTYKASLRKETVTGGGQSLEGFCFVTRDDCAYLLWRMG